MHIEWGWNDCDRFSGFMRQKAIRRFSCDTIHAFIRIYIFQYILRVLRWVPRLIFLYIFFLKIFSAFMEAVVAIDKLNVNHWRELLFEIGKIEFHHLERIQSSKGMKYRSVYRWRWSHGCKRNLSNKPCGEYKYFQFEKNIVKALFGARSFHFVQFECNACRSYSDRDTQETHWPIKSPLFGAMTNWICGQIQSRKKKMISTD